MRLAFHFGTTQYLGLFSALIEQCEVCYKLSQIISFYFNSSSFSKYQVGTEKWQVEIAKQRHTYIHARLCNIALSIFSFQSAKVVKTHAEHEQQAETKHS